jgi:hypothetical protein
MLLLPVWAVLLWLSPCLLEGVVVSHHLLSNCMVSSARSASSSCQMLLGLYRPRTVSISSAHVDDPDDDDEDDQEDDDDNNDDGEEEDGNEIGATCF